MNTVSPYSTPEFQRTIHVVTGPKELPRAECLRGLLYASPVIGIFWAIVYFGYKELVR